jgi:hypothetical protein
LFDVYSKLIQILKKKTWPVDRLRDFGADRTLCANTLFGKYSLLFSQIGNQALRGPKPGPTLLTPYLRLYSYCGFIFGLRPLTNTPLHVPCYKYKNGNILLCSPRDETDAACRVYPCVHRRVAQDARRVAADAMPLSAALAAGSLWSSRRGRGFAPPQRRPSRNGTARTCRAGARRCRRAVSRPA